VVRDGVNRSAVLYLREEREKKRERSIVEERERSVVSGRWG
jgi:hypothetical protein